MKFLISTILSHSASICPRFCNFSKRDSSKVIYSNLSNMTKLILLESLLQEDILHIFHLGLDEYDATLLPPTKRVKLSLAELQNSMKMFHIYTLHGLHSKTSLKRENTAFDMDFVICKSRRSSKDQYCCLIRRHARLQPLFSGVWHWFLDF